MHFASLVPRLSPHVNKIQQATESWLGPGNRLALCIALILLTLVQELNVSGVVVSVRDVWPWTVGVALTARI